MLYAAGKRSGNMGGNIIKTGRGTASKGWGQNRNGKRNVILHANSFS